MLLTVLSLEYGQVSYLAPGMPAFSHHAVWIPEGELMGELMGEVKLACLCCA